MLEHVFVVTDTPFNQGNNLSIIGLYFEIAPAYVEVMWVIRPENELVYKNYHDWAAKTRE